MRLSPDPEAIFSPDGVETGRRLRWAAVLSGPHGGRPVTDPIAVERGQAGDRPPPRQPAPATRNDARHGPNPEVKLKERKARHVYISAVKRWRL